MKSPIRDQKVSGNEHAEMLLDSQAYLPSPVCLISPGLSKYLPEIVGMNDSVLDKQLKMCTCIVLWFYSSKVSYKGSRTPAEGKAQVAPCILE